MLDADRRAPSDFPAQPVRRPPHPSHSTAIMSTPSPFKAPLILVLSIVLLFAGVAVLIGVFGLLIKLFGLT
ncbi:hypothetical protein bAD24_III12670 [Burkholderia sp. AD24]|nr:hypothetical protein bAD24_III12670 [Burkholderia sp. AD24]